MSDELYDFKVTDNQSFIRFMELLQKDLAENPEDWENDTLPRFLEALTAYADAINVYPNNTNQNTDANIANWSVFADIFRGTKIYE